MDQLFVGKGTKSEYLNLALANRHGLITGATGTGKTVTLQGLAEGFSRAGVPVFAADVKGDLSGIAASDRFPVVFWDLFGQQGHPVRARIWSVGPILLSRMMGLNAVQEGVLNIAFRVAQERGLLLDDLKDLRALLTFLTTPIGSPWAAAYGNVSKPTVGTIARQILVLENQGGGNFFGLPTIELDDFISTDAQGQGRINILAADQLMHNPQRYATFLLWLLTQLEQQLPEVGDQAKPKLVFFFDEAHLLFTDAPKPLLYQIEHVVRLIRSKGVGVYFVTQNPRDVPDKVLGQLGNRVQQALRAFTPRDQKAVKAAADTFRPNPKLNTAKVIMELGTGEALVSFLDQNGVPAPVERISIRKPLSRIGALSASERQAVLDASPIAGNYDEAVDRVSAYHLLTYGLPPEVGANIPQPDHQTAERPPWFTSRVARWLLGSHDVAILSALRHRRAA
jgi:DNA helicase HerA-like ATPase